MDPLVMRRGTRVAERFEIENEVHRGSADVVYRALDHGGSQGPVALRVLWSAPRALEGEQFLNEIRGLAEIGHPGIEVPVAHGRTPEGLPFIATAWIEGVSLRERLLQGRLRVGESLTLLTATATALGAAHRRGVAHGDLKPGRLLLRAGRPDDVVITGFGISDRNLAWASATGLQHVVDALRYVAPEQARGLVQRSAGADVFSLGCILLTCLTGVSPFDGPDAAAVLGQILFEGLPPVGRRWPELPQALVQLVEAMLEPEPERRPGDGDAVAKALGRLGLPREQLERVIGSAAPATLALTERQLVCLVLGRPIAEAGDAERPSGAAAGGAALAAELEHFKTSFGAQVEWLADGSLVARLQQTEQTATDLAAQAARLALLWRKRMPGWALALALGMDSGHSLAAETLDRASKLLARPAAAEASSSLEDPRGAAEPSVGPWLDEIAARLLELHFDVRRTDDGRALLTGRRSGHDEVRPLLGTVTPCLGRERELGLLMSWIDHSIEEPVAQMLLVTAPSGTGKSRLRQELVQRLRQRVREGRGHEVAIWIGRGDPIRTGTAYSLLGQALGELCGIHGHGDAQVERARLRERVSRHLGHPGSTGPAPGVAAPPIDSAGQVVEFLGELCGLPFPDEGSPRLRAARQDPRLMSHQVSAAFVAFLAAECARQPVLLVLEDLHWSDVATVRLVEVALAALAEQPLVVLALARPEAKDMFPWLWTLRRVQELRLQGLSKKASRELALRVLSPRVSDPASETNSEAATEAIIDKIVTQAGGNALFLEELIRVAAEGRAQGREGDQPETVLAMLQARLARLDPAARRFLRTASLFGDSFWPAGVHALLGEEQQDERSERTIMLLLDQEVLALRGESRDAESRQLAFRHSLLRDAAYGLMAEEDRRRGHRLAAAWLEQSGERDPMVLAEHYRRGGELERAAIHLARAAHQALAASDLPGALQRAAQGVACGARGELLGTLRSIEAWAQIWQGNFQPAYEGMLAASELLPAGSAGWMSIQGMALMLSGFQGQHERLREHLQLLDRADPLPGAESAFMEPAMMALTFSSMQGLRALSARFLERLHRVRARLGPEDSRAQGMLEYGVAWHALLGGDLWTHWSAVQTAEASCARAEDRRYLYGARGHIGVGYLMFGDLERGRILCRESIDLMVQHGEPVGRWVMQSLYILGLAYARRPEHTDEVRKLNDELQSGLPAHTFWTGMAQASAALAEAMAGDFRAGEAAARRALEILATTAGGLPMACAFLGQCLLAQGRLDEAAAAVEQGLAQLRAQGGEGLYDTELHEVAAEIWRALGQEEAAARAAAEAERQRGERAARIPDPETRRHFLARSSRA
ncbi:MAG TPA: AAA family ATPase [Polyangia bacterium]|jgi:hypothetical protein|nr:AAA family ATPase [Polyangia bacterium]